MGPDGIPGELYKYGSNLLTHTIKDCFNTIFEKHVNIDINVGDMITPYKPGKPEGPVKNLRPLTLLNTIRKALYIISYSTRKNQTFYSYINIIWSKWIPARQKHGRCSLDTQVAFSQEQYHPRPQHPHNWYRYVCGV